MYLIQYRWVWIFFISLGLAISITGCLPGWDNRTTIVNEAIDESERNHFLNPPDWIQGTWSMDDAIEFEFTQSNVIFRGMNVSIDYGELYRASTAKVKEDISENQYSIKALFRANGSSQSQEDRFIRLGDDSISYSSQSYRVELGSIILYRSEGGNQLPNNEPIKISLNQILGFWESQAEADGSTGYFYRFNQDGTLQLHEEALGNPVLNGSFVINDYSMSVELRNPSTNGVILTMEWQLFNSEPNELVFRTVPDEAIIWLKRVN